MNKIIAAFIGLILCKVAFANIVGEPKESMVPGWQLTDTMRLIQQYADTHSGVLPENWSAIWNTQELAWGYRRFQNRPMLHRQIAFVEPDSAVSTNAEAPKIVAITRETVERPFGPIQDGKRQWVKHRLMVVLGRDGKLRPDSIEVDKPLAGIDLNKLVLKEPDLTERQIADTIAELSRLGANADQIRVAFGNEAIDALKKSGMLDSVSQKILNTSLSPSAKSIEVAALESHQQPANIAQEAENQQSDWSLLDITIAAIAGILIVVTIILFHHKS